jgi:RNA polymerase sigma-70 factor (ECF subfamily)
MTSTQATTVTATVRELVDRAKAGDRDAFEHLAGAVAMRMYSTAMFVLRDADLAGDAVQEALIDLWRKLPTLRESDAFEAWLNKLVIRRCYAAARRTKRLQTHVTTVDVEVGARSEEWRVDTRDEIERAFRRLTPEQRAVLVVHHRLGLRDADAAAALGIPVGTMKSRLSRATAALRAGIEADSREMVSLGGNVA